MNKLFTIIFLLVSSLSFGQGTWTTLGIPTSLRYDDVYFVDENTGWAAGGPSGLIYKTTDGGKTWVNSGTFHKNGSDNPNYLRSIEFMDANIGLCGSLYSALYRTTDGGVTWTDVSINISPRPQSICGLAKADENTIYGVGVWSEPAYVLKSTDKGLTWTYTDMSAYAISLIDVFFFDKDHGFVTGAVSEDANGGGVILYTSDGGQTWTEKFRTKHSADRVWKIQSPDNKHFFASIESFVDETRFIRSADMGQTWEMKTVNPGYYYIQAIGFIDSLRGWTGGNSTLFETKDGGNSWEIIAVGSTYDRFMKVSDKIAYLTGTKVYKFDRTLITGVIDNEPYDPIHKISVAPNPTNGKAMAHVTFGNRTMAHIYLYNLQGKSMNKIFDGAVEAGERMFPVDVSGQPGEMFIVVLNTNEGMVSTKLVKK